MLTLSAPACSATTLTVALDCVDPSPAEILLAKYLRDPAHPIPRPCPEPTCHRVKSDKSGANAKFSKTRLMWHVGVKSYDVSIYTDSSCQHMAKNYPIRILAGETSCTLMMEAHEGEAGGNTDGDVYLATLTQDEKGRTNTVTYHR